MKYKQWLKTEYKQANGKPLAKKTIRVYNKAIKKLSKHLKVDTHKSVADMSTVELNQLHTKLAADKAFKENPKAPVMARSLVLYIQYRKHENK